MEAYKPDMISCAIEWQPSEAAFDVWPPKTLAERANQGKRPYSVPAVPDRMMLSSLMGLSARTTTGSYLHGSVSMGTLAHTGWSFVPSALRQSMPVACSAGSLRKVDLA